MLGFGWTDYMHPIWEVTAVGNYPYLIGKEDWFTSRYLTLSKTPIDSSQNMLTPLSEEPHTFYGQEWGKASFLCCDSLPEEVEALGIIANVKARDSIHNCVVVIEIHDTETDSLVLWHSTPIEKGRFAAGEHVIVDALNFDNELLPKGKTVKTYLWNKGHDQMVQTGMSYYYTLRSPVLKGLYEPLY